MTGIRVLSSQTVRVDMKLDLGSIQQTVSVVGEAALIHTDTQTISSSITTRIMGDLPKSSQSVDTLIGLVPGAATTGGNAMIAGSGYWGGNDWNLNGVSIQDASNGRGAGAYGLGLITLPSTNALQEFKVASGALNAEFRNTTGISMVLKQGTNSYHGEAYWYLENKNLNANAFLNNARGQLRPNYDRDQYGGLIGGPIKKNKLFFFADFFHFRQVSPTIVSLTFPSAAMRQGDFLRSLLRARSCITRYRVHPTLGTSSIPPALIPGPKLCSPTCPCPTCPPTPRACRTERPMTRLPSGTVFRRAIWKRAWIGRYPRRTP